MHPWLLKGDQATDMCNPTTSAERARYLTRVEGIRAKEIHRESSTTPLDSLSAIDQYIISLKRTYGSDYVRFDALEPCPDIVTQIH